MGYIKIHASKETLPDLPSTCFIMAFHLGTFLITCTQMYISILRRTLFNNLIIQQNIWKVVCVPKMLMKWYCVDQKSQEKTGVHDWRLV